MRTDGIAGTADQFVYAAFSEKIDCVMRVKIEEAGQDVFILGEVDDSSGTKIAPGKVGVDFKEFAVANHDACIAADTVTDRIEQPAAAQDYVSGPDLRPDLSERNSRTQQEQQCAGLHRDRIAVTAG
jgi:hypothetical protein